MYLDQRTNDTSIGHWHILVVSLSTDNGPYTAIWRVSVNNQTYWHIGMCQVYFHVTRPEVQNCQCCVCVSGLMNQGGMNWAAMGGGGGDMYRGGGGRSFDQSNKVLRLDSSGNFHPEYGSRDSRGARDDRSRSSYKGRNDRR